MHVAIKNSRFHFPYDKRVTINLPGRRLINKLRACKSITSLFRRNGSVPNTEVINLRTLSPRQ